MTLWEFIFLCIGMLIMYMFCEMKLDILLMRICKEMRRRNRARQRKQRERATNPRTLEDLNARNRRKNHAQRTNLKENMRNVDSFW